MSKRSTQIQETLYCGIDVSAKSLTVAIQSVGQPVEQRSFSNNPNGHRALIVWLRAVSLTKCARRFISAASASTRIRSSNSRPRNVTRVSRLRCTGVRSRLIMSSQIPCACVIIDSARRTMPEIMRAPIAAMNFLIQVDPG
jgi:hypothetical protein